MAKTTPVACTLPLFASLAARAERWHRLMARAMTERAETSDGLRICFRPEAEEELCALVAAETQCCPWAAFDHGDPGAPAPSCSTSAPPTKASLPRPIPASSRWPSAPSAMLSPT